MLKDIHHSMVIALFSINLVTKLFDVEIKWIKMVNHFSVSVSNAISMAISQLNAKLWKRNFQMEGMLDVMLVADLVIFLINAEQEGIDRITVLDKETMCATIATHQVTLQDFVEVRI
jgi:hypothetical protein